MIITATVNLCHLPEKAKLTVTTLMGFHAGKQCNRDRWTVV
jgi:hypothetical protein